MPAYAQPTDFIFGAVKDNGNVFHRMKNKVRRQIFHLKNATKTECMVRLPFQFETAATRCSVCRWSFKLQRESYHALKKRD